MRKLHIAVAATGIAVLAGGGWFYRKAEAAQRPNYRFATVERGTVTSSVSATGTLGAVRTVQVGTQVSGQVSAIYADFNDRVKKGQLLARIDPTLQQQAVQDADAQLERAKAQLDEAQREYDREKQLFDAKIVTASEFGGIESNYQVAVANVKSAQISVDRARQNLAYTAIYAPIDGVIVERNVDVGQTVAASFSAPQLFLIANDLSQMQILASVDESDIGQIHDGQPVTFSVQAYPNQTFNGTVEQVRLQSKTQDNVVNYTAVVQVPNESGKLLPGMTATVDFQTAVADSVLTVPNAALRFKPTAEMQAQVGSSATTAPDSAQRAAWRARRDSAGGAGTNAGRARGASPSASHSRTGSTAMLWYLDKSGKVAVARVRTGLSDGQRTEVRGASLTSGMQIIVGVADGSAATQASGSASSNANPFQPQGGRRGPGGPGF